MRAELGDVPGDVRLATAELEILRQLTWAEMERPDSETGSRRRSTSRRRRSTSSRLLLFQEGTRYKTLGLGARRI